MFAFIICICDESQSNPKPPRVPAHSLVRSCYGFDNILSTQLARWFLGRGGALVRKLSYICAQARRHSLWPGHASGVGRTRHRDMMCTRMHTDGCVHACTHARHGHLQKHQQCCSGRRFFVCFLLMPLHTPRRALDARRQRAGRAS